MVTIFTVSGASEEYRFSLPAKGHEHIAFMSVTIDKKELEFEREEAKAGEGEGLVFYSAAVGQLDDGARIAVGFIAFRVLTSLRDSYSYFLFIFCSFLRVLSLLVLFTAAQLRSPLNGTLMMYRGVRQTPGMRQTADCTDAAALCSCCEAFSVARWTEHRSFLQELSSLCASPSF